MIFTLEFNKVNRSQYGGATDFQQDIVEYKGDNCYIPASGNFSVKCFKYFTKNDYTEEFLTFIRSEPRRSNVMISARIQPFGTVYIINTGYYDGYRVHPRTITERKVALYIHKNYLSLIWTSQFISSNKATEDELKPKFNFVDNVSSDKHVQSFIKDEYKPKKVQSH